MGHYRDRSGGEPCLLKQGMALIGPNTSVCVRGTVGMLGRGENVSEPPTFCRGVLTPLNR